MIKTISVVFLTGGVIPSAHAEVCPGSNLERSFSNPLHLLELRPTPIPLQLLFVQNLKYQMSFLGENKLFHKGTQNRNNYKNVLSKNGKYSLTKKIREFNLHTAHSSVR